MGQYPLSVYWSIIWDVQYVEFKIVHLAEVSEVFMKQKVEESSEKHNLVCIESVCWECLEDKCLSKLGFCPVSTLSLLSWNQFQESVF